MTRIQKIAMTARPAAGARRVPGRITAFVALAAAHLAAFAQVPADPLNYSRGSSFSYYDANAGAKAGLLKSETVEPDRPDLCVVTTHAYDDFGNRVSSTTANCAGASAGASFTARTTSTAYGAMSVTVAGKTVVVPAGTAASSLTNAKNQSETHLVDPRFGKGVSLTGPNQLTTAWTLDDFGRAVQAINPDGTEADTAYCYLSGKGVDTSSNSTGAGGLAGCDSLQTGLSGSIPVDAVMFVYAATFKGSAQIGPATVVFSDRAGRKLRTLTEGFDDASQPSAARLVAQDIEYTPLGVQSVSTQPYFIGLGASTSSGTGARGATRTEVDALGRPVRLYVRDDRGSQANVAFGSVASGSATLTTIAYEGLATRTTITRAGSGDDGDVVKLEEKSIDGQVVRVTDALGAQLVQRYDAFGNLIGTTDALGNSIAIGVDLRGRKVSTIDPDAGEWHYGYDALGQLTSQQTAQQRVDGTQTTMQYDVLGRMIQRAEPEATGSWSYDGCDHGVGKLCGSQTDTLVRRSFAYDALGRPISSRTDITGGPSVATALSYDVNGRVASQTYPTGFQVGYDYTARGFLKALKTLTAVTLNPLPPTAGGAVPPSTSYAKNSVLWTAGSYNAWGAAERTTYGNGVVNALGVDPVTGRIAQMSAGLNGGTELSNVQYTWDDLGRVKVRQDLVGPGDGSGVVQDSLFYDRLGRLHGYYVDSPSQPGLHRAVQLIYNAGGLTLYKSDVGVYNYGSQATPGVRPHALQSIDSGTAGIASAAYGYDANGNLTGATAGSYRSIQYTSFNLPTGQGGVQGPDGGARFAWGYDENHQRLKEVRTGSSQAGDTSSSTTWMFHPDNQGGLGFESETVTGGAGARLSNRHYLTANGVSIGVIVTADALPSLTASQTAPVALDGITAVKLEYWHKDQLGSLIATSDHRGLATARYSYDPFGKRRMVTGEYDASGTLVYRWTTDTDHGGNRGFTGHEQLDDVGLVHMNGRIYDPTLGRFLQTDPFVQDPTNLQNYNRYGYCFNNPASCTDPTGQLFGIDDWIVYAVIATWAAEKTHIIDARVARQITGILASVALGPCSGCEEMFGGGITQAAVAGFAGGAISTGSFKGALQGAFSAGVFYEVGSFIEAEDIGRVGGIGLHAVAGCVTSEVGGGKCGPGALSAAFAKAMAPTVMELTDGDRLAGTLVSAVVGGTGSVLGGGKFGNGAITGAFSYLFNELAHSTSCVQQGYCSKVYDDGTVCPSGKPCYNPLDDKAAPQTVTGSQMAYAAGMVGAFVLLPEISIPRALLASDLGLVGTVTQLDGTIALVGTELRLTVDMIAGRFTTTMAQATANLNTLAASVGATTISIQATIANPALARALMMQGWTISPGVVAPYTDTISRVVK